MILESNAAIADYCATATNDAWLALDTEFLRTTTYRAQLCLVQLNCPSGGIKAIDPLQQGTDLAPLWALLANRNVEKILHSGRQDIEIFWQMAEVIPAPLFDTQVAASALGYGDQVGYDKLVKAVTGKGIDKSSRFSDWSRRPLSSQQLDYALDDVRHLPAIYEKLRSDLAQRGRLGWIAEEMAILTEPDTYTPKPEEAFRRLKMRGGGGAFRGRAAALAQWREEQAIARNQVRTRIMRDEILLKLAAEPPKNATQLAKVPGIGKPAQEDAATLQQRLIDAVAMPLPAPPPWAGASTPAAELLKMLLRIRCQQEDISDKLISTGDDMDKLAHLGEKADIPALHGWRRSVFGNDALALLEGNILFRYDADGGTVVVERKAAS